MGTEKPLMEYLSKWTAALDSTALTEKLREQPRRTPGALTAEELVGDAQKEGELSAHDLALFAAVALVDAVDLRCSGTDEGRAIMLCEGLFDEQMRSGFMCLGAGRNELLTSANGHLWDAAFAAILYVARRRSILGLQETAAYWWRQRLDLWREHVTPKGTILAPCLGGGTAKNPAAAASPSADGIFQFIEKGKGRDVQHFSMTGLRLFMAMPDTPLPPPPNPWPLPGQLRRFRYSDGYVSVLEGTAGEATQSIVGTTSWKAPGAVEAPGGWAVVEGDGAQVAVPPGTATEMDFSKRYGYATVSSLD